MKKMCQRSFVPACTVLVGVLVATTSGQAVFPDLPPAKTIRVNGVDLHYVEQGTGEPVILIHGMLHDYRLWSLQVPEFSRHFRVIAYSMRYRWPAPPPDANADVSPAANRSDLLALIKQLGLGPVHLVGHSAGAGVALSIAREHPGMVRTVVLGEPGGPLFFPGAQPPAAPFSSQEVGRVKAALNRKDIDAALKVVIDAVIGTAPSDRPLPPWGYQMLKDNAWQLARLGARTPAESPASPMTCETAHAIKTPALLLGGEHSLPRFKLVLDGLQKCLGSPERAVLPKATHGLELDHPSAFNEIVIGFLNRHRGSPTR